MVVRNPRLGGYKRKRFTVSATEPTMSLFRWINARHWMKRWPMKWLIFAVAALIVCFPFPNLLWRHLQHWRDPNALIVGEQKVLDPLVEEIRPSVDALSTPKEKLRRIEKFVYEKVPYDWDWNTWGQADYFPTVEEVMQKGKEDCDGRAVVAAALMRRFGFDARIVTDFAHVWVKTPEAEWMGPGKTKTVVVTDRGLQWQWRGLLELPKAFAYGVAVFPWVREVILLFVTWILLLGPGVGLWRAFIGWVFFAVALPAIRYGGYEYLKPRVEYQWIGLAALMLGFTVMMIGPRRRASQLVAPPVTSTDTKTPG